ncbi:MAG: LysM peptidoglycan-binding domain-containing protein, partial [Thermodesulfobacteriota bacterium]|nr:LysM peptidoglycan-binding domain-containing protein [Thermodesulfobacteriota bacterium]
MAYQVQRGDTIAKVTQLLKTNWEELRSLNPKAVGRSTKTGNWFLKEGALLKFHETFNAVLNEQIGIDEQSVTRKTVGDSERWIDYTVKSGDTLWTLAVKRFHVNIE